MRFGTFFLPGPTEVHPFVMAAMSQPMIAHRGPETAAIFEAVQPVLRELFGTAHEVAIGVCSSTGMMEAGLRLLPPGRLLSLVNGAFSERYAQIAEACGFDVERFEVAWGEVHDPDAVRSRLRNHVAVTVVHSETSTGALQPIDDLRGAAGGVPLIVDSVSGVGGTPFSFDAWDLGYACTGSQKALALPPGIAFGVASPALLARPPRPHGFYLDLRNCLGQQPPFTPALPQMYALRAQVERIAMEGLAARLARHAAMAERTREWARGHPALRILARDGFRSPTVTAFLLPAGKVSGPLVRAIAKRGFTVATGYGKLKDSSFRIGHMGDQDLATLLPLLAACDEALKECGFG